MNPVLCVTRNSIEEAMRLKPAQGNNVYPLDIREVGTSNFHFLSRQIADSKHASDIQVAKYLPQLLPYVVVTCKDEVLTYSRAKGTEDRFITPRKEKVYIYATKLERDYKDNYDIRYITKKIKKDNTLGLISDNSWGYSIKDLLEMEKI